MATTLTVTFHTGVNPFGPQSSSSSIQPPKSSVFSPQVANRYPTASAFRNPAFNSAPPPPASFTTPRKPFDEVVMSEVSGAESSPATTTGAASPALTDTSETTQQDRHLDTIRAFSPSRKPPLQSGRGTLPRRGNQIGLFGRAAGKVRKRQRYNDDRDVGSVRNRMEHASNVVDGDDSDDTDAAPRGGGRRQGKKGKGGWVRSVFGVIHDHPRIPEILTYYLQFAMNAFLVGVFVYAIWAAVASVRDDVRQANENARVDLLRVMDECAQEFAINQCATSRLPALQDRCRDWQACMNDDPNRVMRVQNAAKEGIYILNTIGENVSVRTMVRVSS